MGSVLSKDVERLQQDVQILRQKFAGVKEALQQNEERIEALLSGSGYKDESIQALEADIASREREIAALQQTRQELQNRIEELEAEVKQRDIKIAELEDSLAAKDPPPVLWTGG